MNGVEKPEKNRYHEPILLTAKPHDASQMIQSYDSVCQYSYLLNVINLGLAQNLHGFLSAKCPVFLGLLRADYAKLFLYDPLSGIKQFSMIWLFTIPLRSIAPG
jgi:hypothetical protein